MRLYRALLDAARSLVEVPPGISGGPRAKSLPQRSFGPRRPHLGGGRRSHPARHDIAKVPRERRAETAGSGANEVDYKTATGRRHQRRASDLRGGLQPSDSLRLNSDSIRTRALDLARALIKPTTQAHDTDGMIWSNGCGLNAQPPTDASQATLTVTCHPVL